MLARVAVALPRKWSTEGVARRCGAARGVPSRKRRPERLPGLTGQCLGRQRLALKGTRAGGAGAGTFSSPVPARTAPSASSGGMPAKTMMSPGHHLRRGAGRGEGSVAFGAACRERACKLEGPVRGPLAVLPVAGVRGQIGQGLGQLVDPWHESRALGRVSRHRGAVERQAAPAERVKLAGVLGLWHQRELRSPPRSPACHSSAGVARSPTSVTPVAQVPQFRPRPVGHFVVVVLERAGRQPG
jgi:hypothetical protein